MNTFFHSYLPFVVHPARCQYAGKSFLVHMRIAFKLKYVLLTISLVLLSIDVVNLPQEVISRHQYRFLVVEGQKSIISILYYIFSYTTKETLYTDWPTTILTAHVGECIKTIYSIWEDREDLSNSLTCHRSYRGFEFVHHEGCLVYVD